MVEALESYSGRFWRRFRKDATPWARDNIIWGIIALVVPPLAAYLRDPHTQIDWVLIRNSLWLYAFAFAIYILVHLCRTPKKLDNDREAREKALVAVINEWEKAIAGLSEKPQRTPAEQHRYDLVKRALKNFGPKGVIALRHLQIQGTLTFTGPWQCWYSASCWDEPTGYSLGLQCLRWREPCDLQGKIWKRRTNLFNP